MEMRTRDWDLEKKNEGKKVRASFLALESLFPYPEQNEREYFVII